MSDLVSRAFAPVLAAIEEGRIPGAVLGIFWQGGATFRHAGHARIVPTAMPMREDTLFDLASLTKPIATTTAILRLVEQGRVGLDDTLASIIPDLRQYDIARAIERRLTLRQCLAHQTHLPAVEPLYTYGQDPRTLRAFILQRAWQAGPAVYSDINFLYLGIAIERLTGAGLMPPDGFTFTPEPAVCAATEHCTWRARVLQGEVHDENAFAMGGAAGHAGLFGSAGAVLGFAASLLDGSLLAPASIACIRTRIHATRTLGWEAAHSGWSGGDTCSAGTIGHTGFTGTGLWIDWERNLAWTLLTNRVHPSRHAESGIAALRRAVGQAVCG
jgi:CubicO group peptidase (beta-lactamase class C family)